MPRRLEHGRNGRNHAHSDSSLRTGWYLDTGDDGGDRVDGIKRELGRLMEEHLESLKKQAFLPPDTRQRESDENRLKRIREVSADYLAALSHSHVQIGGENMTDKPNVKLPGKVEKVIEPVAGEPEKAQIAIEGADPLYREIRIENTLKDGDGEKVRLKQNDEVDVTVETENSSTEAQNQRDPKKKELPERKAS